MAGSDQQSAEPLPTGRARSLQNLKGGSRKGKPNKTTVIAKEAIAAAFDQLGGTDRLVKWCREDEKNESAFWTTIYPKLLPLQLTGEGGGPVQYATTRTIVDPQAQS